MKQISSSVDYALPAGSEVLVTVTDVAVQLRQGPRRAAGSLRRLRRLYGASPNLLHLALYSVEDNLAEMLVRLRPDFLRPSA